MGGGGTSSGESAPGQNIFGSPISGMLANMFGIGTSITGDGGITYGGNDSVFNYDSNKWEGGGEGDFQFANPIFGPGSGFENIAGFFEQMNPYGEQATALGQKAAEGGIDMADFLSNSAVPAMAEMTKTGSPTDVSSIVEQSMADVAERFTGTSGVNSSDFSNAAMRESAQLRVGAEEAAKSRQMSALGFTPAFSGSFNNISQMGGDLLRLGEDINLSSTATGRAVAGAQLFAGMQPTGAVSRGNVSSSEGKNASVL